MRGTLLTVRLFSRRACTPRFACKLATTTRRTSSPAKLGEKRGVASHQQESAAMSIPPNKPKKDAAGPLWSTLSVHGGEEQAKARSALTEPIFLSSTYSFADTQSLIDFIVQKQPREEYARYGNPTEKTVERKLAALEGAEDAVLYSSGMTAIAGLLLGKLRAGDEIVLVDECYLRTRDLCLQELSRFGITDAACAALRLRRAWRPPSRRPRGCCSASRPPIRT